MNKHIKLIFSVLFIVIILLAAAITRFYSDTGQKMGGTWTASNDIEKLNSAPDGSRIFRDSSGLYGIIDQSDRILVSPEWITIDFAGNEKCIVSKTMKGKKLFGCINYEGNLVVPLVYSSITRHAAQNTNFYTAVSEADGSCVIYDSSFNPLLSRAWDAAVYDKERLVLVSGQGTYIYSVGDSGFSLSSAKLSGNTLGCDFSIEISSKILLSKLAPSMLEEMAQDAEKYIEYAFTDSSDCLAGIRTSGAAVFAPLFPDEKNITSKELISITDIYLYSVRADDSVPHYAVSVTANAEITYTDKDGASKKISNACKASVEFSGNSIADLAVVSGKFTESKPAYPQTIEDDSAEISDKPSENENNPPQ